MHENFIALDEEKRDRIINAAMREFSEKGYKNASTNEIVKKAGISKGALFHYFHSKRDLYEFLFSYSMEFFMAKVKPRIGGLPSDVFDRWIAFTAVKVEIGMQYPDMAAFVENLYKEDMTKTSGIIRAEFEKFSINIRDWIYKDIDTSKFKPGTDMEKAFQIIWWVLEGYVLTLRSKDFSFTAIIEKNNMQSLILEINEYLSLLKKAFYKEEYIT